MISMAGRARSRFTFHPSTHPNPKLSNIQKRVRAPSRLLAQPRSSGLGDDCRDGVQREAVRAALSIAQSRDKKRLKCVSPHIGIIAEFYRIEVSLRF